MSRLSHHHPGNPEMWEPDELGRGLKPVSWILRKIMREQVALRGADLCDFCQLQASTHTLVLRSEDDLGDIPVEVCDSCDDLPVELA